MDGTLERAGLLSGALELFPISATRMLERGHAAGLPGCCGKARATGFFPNCRNPFLRYKPARPLDAPLCENGTCTSP